MWADCGHRFPSSSQRLEVAIRHTHARILWLRAAHGLLRKAKLLGCVEWLQVLLEQRYWLALATTIHTWEVEREQEETATYTSGRWIGHIDHLGWRP